MLSFEERFKLLVESGQASEKTIAATKMAIALVESHYGIKLTEVNASMLVTHLAITLRRLMDGEMLIEMPDVVWQEIREYPEELDLAASIVSEIEEFLGASISRSEVAYIAVHLARLKTEAGPGRDS